MGKKGKRLCAAVLGLSMVMGSMPVFASTSDVKPDKLKIGVLSDTHYFSESLYSDCEDFTTAMNSDRKMFRESEAITDSALDQMVKDEVDVIVVSGDLTKDGEQVNHEAFASKLKDAKKKLKAKGVDTDIYVINGNHDINNPNGKDYSSGKAVDADRTTTEEFKEIYKDFGYGSDSELYSETYKGGCLSYVAHPAEGFTLIAVDSGKYSSDQTSSDQDLQETGGVISEDLLKWIDEKSKEAKAKGDVVMVMQHHGVIEHFSEEPQVMADYLVDNYKTVQQIYADAGVNNVFSGHMHANDIAEYKSEAGNVLYDIETGSLVTYPSPTRIVNITNRHGVDGIGAEYDVATKLIKSINYTDSETGQQITDLTEYGKKHTLSVEVVQTMLTQQLLGPAIDNINANGGIRTILAQITGSQSPENVDADLTSLAVNMLPKTKEEGWSLDVSGIKLKVYYDAEAAQIKISQDTDSAKTFSAEELSDRAVLTKTDGSVETFDLPEEVMNDIKAELKAQENVPSPAGLFDPIEIYMTYDKAKALVGSLLTQADEKILADKSTVYGIVNKAVEELLTASVDGEHTVFDIVNEIYQGHLAGEENAPKWLQDALVKLGNENLLGETLKNVLKNDSQTMGALSSVLEKVNIDLKGSIDKGNNSIATGVAVSTVANMIKNGADVLKLIDIASLIPENIYAGVNDFAYKVGYSMAYDTNYAQDNNTTIVFEGTIPDGGDGEDGNGGQDQGQDQNQGSGQDQNQDGNQSQGNNQNQGQDQNHGIDQSTDKTDSENIQTGDSSEIAVYMTMIAATLAAVYAIRRMKKN